MALKKKHYPILAILVIVVVWWFGSPRTTGNVSIAVIGPLSGPAAQYGLSQKNGAKLALDLINKSGGIRGKSLEAIFLDDANDKVKAAEVGRDAIFTNGVSAIIGTISSDGTMNLQRICEKAQIPLLTAVSTNPFITRVNFQYSFRCLSDDNVQAIELAKNAYNRRGVRRLAIIHDNNKYGSAGARTYQNYVRQLGQNIVANEGFDENSLNFRTQLQKIKLANPDGLLVWGLYKECGLIVRQAREMGITVPVFGPDGMAITGFLDIAGTAAEGVTLTYPFSPQRVGDLATQFLDEYRKTYGMEADSFAAHGYDAMTLIARAMAASDGSGPGIRNALAQIRQYDGVTGKGGFDETGNETRPVQLAQVKNGQFVPVTQ